MQQIEEIFSRIIDLPHERRADAILTLCGTDSELRAEVESLLRHADPPNDFLVDSALGIDLTSAAHAVVEDDLVGQMVGPYRITHRLASGGMGTVYRAVRADGQFEQDVAIKLVKPGMDTEQILRHFARERQTLASLRHPNIAQLLDAGAMTNGRPYFVMEYVGGIAIDQYCEEHCLAIADRLRLFCVVCEAVRLAHQKLVVHRDLKPGNILVDETGNPKLLDFGVSKVLDDDSINVTILEERRFTPEYASPEQVSGQPLSTASDVYSLGIILFELLTGRRPYRFSTRSMAEIVRVVCQEQTLAPSIVVESKDNLFVTVPASSSLNIATCRGEPTVDRLARRLRGDIDTIILKATHKDPSRRYVSVEQLITDIERYLSGLPILARPDTATYRFGKFLKRHAIAVTVSLAAILLLNLGLAVAIRQGNIARNERDAAYLARDQSEATTDFVQRMIAAAHPANEGPDTRVRTILDAAASRVESDLRSQPLVQAAVRSAIGRSYLGLGLLKEAQKNIEAAHAVRKAHLPTGHHDLAESEFDLAKLSYAQGKLNDAESLLIKCLTTHRRLRGQENLDTARVLNDLGTVQQARGALAQAEQSHREALRIREKLGGRESLEVAESLINLANVLQARGAQQDAETLRQEAIRIRRNLLREDDQVMQNSHLRPLE